MSSDIGSPATLPVQPSSEPTSPVLSGPLALELVTDRPVSVCQYNGATHYRKCHCPKKYDLIGLQCGLVDRCTCQCSKSPSPPENTVTDAHILFYFSVFYIDLFEEVFVLSPYH